MLQLNTKKSIFLKLRSCLLVKVKTALLPLSQEPKGGAIKDMRASRPLTGPRGGVVPQPSSFPHGVTKRPRCIGSSGYAGPLMTSTQDGLS